MYTVYAKTLKWGEYFKLTRKLLYKIDQAARRNAEVSAVKADFEMEKTLTKCLCKVLEGFPDNT